jgi:Flp pilus assembly protein TadG
MPGFLRRFARNEQGVSAVVIGIGLTIMMGGAGLAIDIGLWYNDKRVAQGAADSAAFSAAVDYAAGDTATGAAAAAKAITAQYGMTNGSNGVTVTVNQPPRTGSNSSNSSAIEVIVQKTETRFFAGLFMNSAAVSARAVAIAGSSVAKYCILALDPTPATSVSTAGIGITGGATVDASACGFQVNATGPDALYLTGGAHLYATSLSVVGNYSVTGGSTMTVTGTTTTSASSISDPYAGVAVPSPGACAATNTYGFGTWTLSPTTYCNGLTLQGGGSFTMNPGVYIIDRGNFHLGNGATLNAMSGVTIVLTSSSGSNYATATIDGGTTLNITAPTTGATKGLAIFQDRRAALSGVDTITGGAALNVTGALYFPNQVVNYQGGTTTTALCTQLIAYRINYTGGTKFNNSCAGTGVIGIGTAATTLVE